MSAYLIPLWLKIMPERGILIFLIFYYIFRNFLARVEYERNSGLKYFSLFFVVSHSALARNNAGKRFYNFSKFLNIFFGIFLPGSSMNGIRDKKFFSSFFRPISFPFSLKIMLESGFKIFWIFLLFFSEFSCPGRVWTEFGTKFFFLFHLISPCFG